MKNHRLDSFERLQHIIRAIESIHKYVANETSDSFEDNDLIHDAVLFQFSIIGEAINFVESDILDKFDYPWFKVRAFRNLISHEYFNIKMVAVWQIIQTDLSELKFVVQTILKSEFNSPCL